MDKTGYKEQNEGRVQEMNKLYEYPPPCHLANRYTNGYYVYTELKWLARGLITYTLEAHNVPIHRATIWNNTPI